MDAQALPDTRLPVLPGAELRGRWSQRWAVAQFRPGGLARIAGVSAAVHLVVIGALLLVQALRWVPLPGAAPQPAVIEMVLNDPGAGSAPRDRGEGRQAHAPPRPQAPAAPAAARPPPVPAPPRPQSAAAAAPRPPLPSAPDAALPPPVPSPPEHQDTAVPPPPTPNMNAEQEDAPGSAATRTPPTPPAEAPPPAVRLGEDGENGETDDVMGQRTAPPALDGSVRNIPPRYPRAAALRQEEGQVLLLLHLSADGAVMAADIARSSGYVSLDDAAQAAVLTWRFKPALKDGLPVESALPYGITFQLTAPTGVPRQ